MKKIILLAVAAAFTLSASAEGYQVNTLSAKQLGMGHTGVSQKLDAESVWFNPAAAVYQDNKFSVAAGVTGIMATATFTTQTDYVNPTKSYESDNDWSTPMYLYANYKVNDKLAVGLSFNTPFGSSMNWGDNWGGAHLIQSISLSAYSAQPTVSYKLLDGKLSIGAGLMMSWGTFELSRSMFEVGATSNTTLTNKVLSQGLDAVNALYGSSYTLENVPTQVLDVVKADPTVAALMSGIDAVGDTPLASATLSGDAGLAVGVNVGVMYDINEKWCIGASYRSKMMMVVDAGVAELNYANEEVVKPLLESDFAFMETGTFSAELPLPSTLSFGATFRPVDRWEFSTEFQWVQWKEYKDLDVVFHNDALSDKNIYAEKNYSNTIMCRVGGQYEATDWLTARLGFYVDESPVASEYLNPETPSMTKVGYTSGVSVMPCKNNRLFSIDFSYAYISSADPERMGSYPATNNFDGSTEVFAGNYTTKAHCVSFGATWGF